MKRFETVAVAIAITLPIVSLSFSAKSFIHQLKNHQAESVCIANLIATQHERSNIETLNGTCSLKQEEK